MTSVSPPRTAKNVTNTPPPTTAPNATPPVPTTAANITKPFHSTAPIVTTAAPRRRRRHYNVTLLVYSGRRNPWKQERIILSWKRIFPSDNDHKAIRAKIIAGFPHFSRFDCIPPKSGYKGFLIQLWKGGPEDLILGNETVELQAVLHDSFPKRSNGYQKSDHLGICIKGMPARR